MQLDVGCMIVLLYMLEIGFGMQATVGVWDPAGITNGNADNFAGRRETELKHGHAAMLATTRYITPEFSRWPGSLSPTLGIQLSDCKH